MKNLLFKNNNYNSNYNFTHVEFRKTIVNSFYIKLMMVGLELSNS